MHLEGEVEERLMNAEHLGQVHGLPLLQQLLHAVVEELCPREAGEATTERK